MASPTLKIENARFLITVDPERRIIRDGSVLIEGGRIARVGKAAELAGVGADRVIDGRRFVVTPGFFNGHLHISYAHAVRGIYPDDVQQRLVYVFKLQEVMTEEEEYATTLLGLVDVLKNGTTCFLDPGSTKFPDACLQAYQDAGCRVVLGDGVTDLDYPLALPRYTVEQAAARTRDFFKRWDGRLDGRIRAWAMPFSPVSCSGELLAALKRVADELGTGLTLHHNSGPDLIARFRSEHGALPTEYLERLGLLGPNVMLAHVLGLTEAELDSLARTGTNVTVCPSTAPKEGHGVPANGRLPELLARGLNIALGSDSVNSSNYLDPVRSMNMAAVQYKDARQDTSLVPAETAVELGTLSAARAFLQGDRLGSIEAGKQADLVLFDTQRPEWQALFNPINNLIYSADSRSVHTVIVDGRIVVEDYRQSFVDETRLFERVQEIGEQVLARANLSFPLSRWPIV